MQVEEFLAEIAALGQETAQNGYGGEAVTVVAEPIDNGYAIIASGEAVAFLEFGAGDTVSAGNIFANQMGFLVASGSWSAEHAHQYELTGRWVFGGVVYTQVTPRNAMWVAHDTILEEWRNIAERVFV